MDCKTCIEKRTVESVPFLVHEADMARMERTNKRTWILVIILAALLVVSWAGFLLYESQFETVEEMSQEVTQTSDGDNINRFIGGDFYGSDADN